ncbi:hypothetical protein K3G63_20075 [Hymenobacter sp. HSC-4F20]|uniref:hypothetical protein n=1 Tax=Hymenobacter sp. HSC-4F20 TaxID=2864135 RepID=UPI001C730F70|nr:hypothetical protein [Hymenobacter sp. HSC-4F20]MBX0292752.1 hypothetical protein [Hymenobacter sp. HSC-4F20]
MSTQKSNQPGAPAHKHITFTPASETSQEASDSSSDNNGSASSAYNEPTAGSSSQKQQSWLDQQQWLKNVDVQQLKDLGTKALDQVNKMSPTQKVIGGALLAGGLSWLALRSKSSSAKGETYRAYRGSSEGSASGSSSKWDSSSDSVYRGATRSYGEDDYAADL